MPLRPLVLSRCLTLLLLTLFFFSAPIKAQEPLDNKAQLTAAFIYQITKFTLWPEALYKPNELTFAICVLGQPEQRLLSHLRELESKSTQGYKIEVRHHHNKQQLFAAAPSNCKVLFTTDEEWQKIPTEQVAQLTQTTLLIGSSKVFLQNGGMLALLVMDNKMKIFINASNLSHTPIKLESRLKALAKVF